MHTPADIERHTPARDLLRFITCGSIDDGKSTLICGVACLGYPISGKSN